LTTDEDSNKVSAIFHATIVLQVLGAQSQVWCSWKIVVHVVLVGLAHPLAKAVTQYVSHVLWVDTAALLALLMK